MNVQIFGIKKSNDTRSTERYFKERGIPVHFVDLSEKEISRGELAGIKRSVSSDELIDKECKEYKKLNLAYMQYDVDTVILENPLLVKMPIVRYGEKASCGYKPELWKEWLK